MTDIWHIISDIVLPHIGRIILSILSFSFLGILVSIALLVIMFRKKVMSRSNTAYQIIIRIIYIPLVIIVCIYSFGNWGFIRGAYQVVSAENKDLVDGIYDLSINQYFTTNKEKDLFLKELKTTLLETENSGLSFVDSFEKKISGNQSKTSVPGFISSVTRIYRKEIYNTVLNGVFYTVDSQLNTETDPESLGKAIELLYSMDRIHIENAIKSALEQKLQKMIDGHYQTALISNLLLWFIVLSIPFIEFTIYRLANKKKSLEEREKNGESSTKMQS